MASVLQNLVNEGELPTVKVSVEVSNDTLTDIAIAAVIVVIVVGLINKFIMSYL